MDLKNEDFIKLARIIKVKYGLNLLEKKYLVESRLENYVLDCGFTNFSEYLETVYCDRSGSEMANIINRLTTNYTYFMRETEHFKHFTEVFLKNAEKNFKENELRIWSAGCSFGNEPYNLAMCMDNYFGERKYLWDGKILATDISFNALRMAKKGVFAEQTIKELPAEWIDRYFVRLNSGIYQVSDDLRNDVVFKYHNLMEPIAFKKKFDLIVCRNVMIYFDEQTKEPLFERFYNATNDGGYLYIGHAETGPKKNKYKMERPAIYKKISDKGGFECVTNEY